jgi:hypothetical protein
MATVDQKTETRISQEAATLLDCLATGLDRIVYEVAEQLARERSSALPLRIEAEDVQRAAEKVLATFRTLVSSKQLPQEAAEAIEGMDSCLKQKAKDLGLQK